MIFSMMNFINADMESPKKQLRNGISAEEIQCNAGLKLVIRNNGTPACVKPETVEKMQERGMLFNSIKFTDLQKEIKTIPASEKEIETIPASSMSIVNFYITDHDLNVAHGGVEVIPIQGLFEFTINGIAIDGPENMIETGQDTGQFYIKLELPETIDGRELSQNDIVLIKYLDRSDHSGEKRVLVKSVPLTKTFASIGSTGGDSRIGHEFTVRIYEPDANLDSRDVDRIPLSRIEYKGEGGIRTTLSNPVFDANASALRETGENNATY